MTQLASGCGLAMNGSIFADSSAALVIAKRRGSGKDETCQDWDPLDSREQ